MVPSVTAPRRRATYADLVEVPEHLVAEIRSALFDRFNGPPGGADAPGGWWILDEPELHLGEDVLVPTTPGGGASGCPSFPTSPRSSLRPTGCAR